MPPANQLLTELEALQTEDEVLTEVAARCHQVLAEFAPVRALSELRVFVVL